MVPDDIQPLLHVGDVARILGVQTHRVYTLIREGHLPCVRLGQRQLRISQEVVRVFIERGGNGALQPEDLKGKPL